MSTCNDLTKLNEVFKERVDCFLDYCKSVGQNVKVLETFRSNEVQLAYYSQGRYSLDYVNRLRSAAGLYLIGDKENSYTITKTTSSMHSKGLAVDLMPLSRDNVPYGYNLTPEWAVFGSFAEKYGLDWCFGLAGKSWNWDICHFEHRF